MKEAEVYETCRIHPEDEFKVWARRIYGSRSARHTIPMTGIKATRAYKAAFQPMREPQRYEPGKNWKFRSAQWPARRGRIQLINAGPYRNHGKGNYAGMVRAQCDCGATLWIACGTWLGAADTKLCPEQCEGCRRQGHKDDISYMQKLNRAAFAKKQKARAWIGNDVTLARAKKEAKR